MGMQLHIDLDRPEAMLERGDPVAGRVSLRAGEPATVEVPLHFEWHVHGKGDSASESLGSETLFTGGLSAGEEKTLPFSFLVPTTAEPYAGELFRVELRLRAVAAIVGEPAHQHPEAVVPLRVAPPPPPKAFRVAPVTETAESGSMGCLFQSLGILVLGGLMVALAIAVPETGFLAPIGGTAVALGIALALIVRKRAFAEREVGSVGVSIAQEGSAGYREAAGSAPLTVTVTTAPKTATARVRLRVMETSPGHDRVRRHEVLHDETVELVDEDPGTFRGRVSMPLPGEVPLPMRRGRSLVEWEVFVTVDAPGAPEWLQRYALEVTGV